jgi:hypothetical protein
VRIVKASLADSPYQFYLLANAGMWLVGADPTFEWGRIEKGYGNHAHGGQAQLQSHGLVLLLI